MSQFFINYFLATAIARKKATAHGLDVYVRNSKEFNTKGYVIGFASRNDNDYTVAEIIKPNEPLSQQELDAIRDSQPNNGVVAMTTICRGWLEEVRHAAPKKAVKAFRNAGVLYNSGLGYTVELQDATQFHVGRAHCAYCARAEALRKVIAKIEEESQQASAKK